MICSSKREYITTAAIPASSNFLTVSTFSDSGEADATRGFFSYIPRYVVVRSTIKSLLSRTTGEDVERTHALQLPSSIGLLNCYRLHNSSHPFSCTRLIEI